MNLVKFSNGKFGIRKGYLLHKYFDFKSDSILWRHKSSCFFKDCQVDENTAGAVFENINIKDEIIK